MQEQPLLRARPAEQGIELGAEDLPEMAPRQGGQALQQETGLRVGAQQRAVVIDSDQRGRGRVQVLGATVEGEDEIALMVIAEQPVLDMSHGHRDQRLGVGLPRPAIRGGVEDTHQARVGAEHRRRRAG